MPDFSGNAVSKAWLQTWSIYLDKNQMILTHMNIVEKNIFFFLMALTCFRLPYLKTSTVSWRSVHCTEAPTRVVACQQCGGEAFAGMICRCWQNLAQVLCSTEASITQPFCLLEGKAIAWFGVVLFSDHVSLEEKYIFVGDFHPCRMQCNIFLGSFCIR